MTGSGHLPPRALLEVAASVGRLLRPGQAERLGAAMASFPGPDGTQHLAHVIPAAAFTQQTARLLQAWAEYPGVSGSALGAAVAAASHAHEEARRSPQIELVVSGPTTKEIHARRTEQVLLQLVGEAKREILLVTFALQMDEDLRDALAAATTRGVGVTVLAEDPIDNSQFYGDPAAAVADLVVKRLRWPADQRPFAGAAMHAKIVIIDESVALITSANLTKRAAGDNLEAGLLIRGGDSAARLAGHVMELLEAGVLRYA
jgi:phosphatidylserine/phosphatidylglycerophosphate/cardiolipin synthase-like enzyme